MNITAQKGLSVNRLVKVLLERIEEDVHAEINTTDGKTHYFRLVKNEGCGVPYFLIYTADNDEGESLTFRHYITCRSSNLPGVTAKRWYILHSRKDRLVQKLHIHSFRNGVFFCVRHDYNHLYTSQTLSRRDRSFQFHDFERKRKELINSKQKLRLEYAGQTTRTAKRLEYLQERIDHYNELSGFYLMNFVIRLRAQIGRE